MKEVNEEIKMQSGLYSRFWVGVTAILSIVVILYGFPAGLEFAALPPAA